MPKHLHEAIVALLHDLPETVPGILVALGTLPADSAGDARAERVNFADAQPVEARPDLVVLCAAKQVLILEVQLRVDRAKKLVWPVYAALARQRFGTTARVVVVTPSARVARWAAEPIQVGGPDEWSRPVVLSPANVPCVTDLATAITHPGAAVLSAVVHAHSPQAASAALAGLQAVDALAADQQFYYNDLILGLLSEADLRALEDLMQQLDANRPALMGVPKGYRPWQFLEASVEARGKAIGKAEGEALARADALEQQRQTLRTVAAARGIALSVEHAARIDQCNDSTQVNQWIVLAATATEAGQVFDAGDTAR